MILYAIHFQLEPSSSVSSSTNRTFFTRSSVVVIIVVIVSFFFIAFSLDTNWAGERELLFGHFIHTLMCPEMVRGDKLSFNSVSFSALQTSWFVVLRQQSEDVIRERVDNALRRPREKENEESRRWWGSRTLRCKFSWSTTTSSIATTRQKHSRMPTERESLSILCGANANILYDQKKKQWHGASVKKLWPKRKLYMRNIWRSSICCICLRKENTYIHLVVFKTE